MNFTDYYQTLSHAEKILFKKKVIADNEWSHDTFHRRFRSGKFNPGEILIIENIIATKSYLKVEENV